MKRKDFLRSFIPAAVGTMLLKNGFSMPDPVSNPPAITPPYLVPGDTIGITCPAGAMASDELKRCRQAMAKWGFNTRYGNTIDKHWQRFGGTDEERAADFQQMLDDDNIRAIMFGRGGYGAMRIMDKINWEKFVTKPKWLIGYSDITAFHCHVQSLFGIPTIHSDMANGFNGTEDETTLSLKNLLTGQKPSYKTGGYNLNRCGSASGKLVGGNLSLLVAMQGSKSALKTDGKILFIEDVSEFKYTIDRMMMNLKRSGMLDHPAGIVFGGFTATKADTEDNYPMSLEEIIFEKVKDFEYPVCFHFPAGHQKQNMALKLGCHYTLEVNEENTILSENSPATARIITMPRTDSILAHADSSQLQMDH